MFESNARPKRAENVRTRKQDGEEAVFNILTADYFILNETGAFIWGLCDGNHTIAEIVEKMKEQFEDLPPEEKVMEEIHNLIKKLQEKELVEVVT